MYYSEIKKLQCFDPNEAGALVVPANHDWLTAAPDGSYFTYPETGLPVLNVISQAVLDEIVWVDAEFAVLDIEVVKLEVGDPAAIGTLLEWQTYGNELAVYVVDFAIVTSKPNRPT